MPYSHHNTMVKGEEFSPTSHLTFQKNYKKTSCLFKAIIIFFILAIIFSSTIFLVHYFAQKLNLDQDYSKLISSKLYVPSFSSFRNSDHLNTIKKNDLTYSDLSHSSSQSDSALSKITIEVQPTYKTSKSTKKKKNLSTISFDVPNNQLKSNNNKTTFSFSQFWNYFKTENFHLYPSRVQKTDILNEDLRQVFLKIHDFATLKGLKLTEFGNRIYKFLAIPYAEPPVGNLRFNEPLEYKPTKELTIDNTKFGPICPQFFDEVLVKTVTPLTRNMSEDCLTLNIWSPKLSKESSVKYSDKASDSKSSSPLWTILNEETLDFEDDDKNSTSEKTTSNGDKIEEELLPVMVWIHGGGFSMGSTALDEYDGSILSSYGNVVVVTINYRLGVFGFFNLNSPQATGNQGLKDQILALKWIKKYIKNFGGDPEKITIFGQSAGGFAVGLHMISPNSKGLFRRAILQSGSPVVFDQFYSNTYNIAKRLVHFVKCDDSEDQDISLSNLPTEPTNTENEEGAEDESEEEEDNKNKDKKIENTDNEKEDTNLKPSASEKDEEFSSDRISRLKRNSEDDEGDDEGGGGEEEETTEKNNLNKTLDSSESETKKVNLNESKSILDKSLDTTVNEKIAKDENEEDNLKISSTENVKDNEKTESSSILTSTLSPSTTIKPTTSKTVNTETDSKKLKFLTLNINSHSTSSDKKPKSLENLFKETNNEKSEKILKCMQSKSMKVLIRAQKNAMQNSMYPFSPNKHESILPKMPAEIIKQDLSSSYFHLGIEQILLGINKDEGSLYLHLTMPQVFPSENLTLNINRLSELRIMLANNLTNAFKVPRSQATIVANLLLNNGPEIDTTENLVKKYYQLIADLMFNCPTVMLADELVKLNYENNNNSLPKKKQVYFYRFNERPSVTNWGEWMGITHHEEVQFVFGMPLKYPLKYNSKDLIFSKRIMKTWAHFANTGEMLPQLDLQWPAYNKHQQLMELNAFESKLTEKLHEKNCNLFRIGFESFMRRKRYVL